MLIIMSPIEKSHLIGILVANDWIDHLIRHLIASL